MTRRSLLGGLAAGTLAGGLLGCGRQDRPGRGVEVPDIDDTVRVQAPIGAAQGELAMPGRYPGRVVEVGHAGSVTDGLRDRAVVKAMADRNFADRNFDFPRVYQQKPQFKMCVC